MLSKLFVLALALCATAASAHHVGDPGSSPATASVLTAHLLEPGQISLGWSWQLTQYPALSKAELEAAVRREQRALYLPEQASSQALELAVGVSPWLQVGVGLRMQRLERLREGHLHSDGSFGSHELGNPAGLGDPELRAKLRLATGEAWSLAGHLGVRLPGGEDDALTDGVSVDATASTVTGKLKVSPKFAYLGPAFQPGSGAAGGTVGLALSREWGLWEGSASLLAQVPAAYRLYKAGASGTLGLALGRLFGPVGHERGWLGLELAAVQAEPSNYDGVAASDGGFSLAGGPRLRLPLGSRALGVLGLGLPLLSPPSRGPAPLGSLSLSLQAFF